MHAVFFKLGSVALRLAVLISMLHRSYPAVAGNCVNSVGLAVVGICIAGNVVRSRNIARIQNRILHRYASALAVNGKVFLTN